MNKGELIDVMAQGAGISKAAAKKALEAGLAGVVASLKKGDKVALIGFGTLSVVKRAARKGVNPATKKAITIPAKNVVKFKAGADLK